MIKITSVEIDGFIVPEQKVKLDFVDSNIICIYGENGSGKTSFLEILFAVFDRDERILEQYNVTSIILNYKSENIQLENEIKENKKKLNKLILELERQYSILNTIKDEDEGEKYNNNNIFPLDSDIASVKDGIQKDITHLESLEKRIKVLKKSDEQIKKDYEENQELEKHQKANDSTIYNWNELNRYELSTVSSLFLGIGRGIHKKELNIPSTKLWHFFNSNRKIDENKILTGNEIDEFSQKLADFLMPKDKSETNRGLENSEIIDIDKKKNIYLPNIEIDSLQELLRIRYKEAVIIAKDKINEGFTKNSLNILNFNSKSTENMDINLNELENKLINNKLLLLEILSNRADVNIKSIFENLENDENFFENIGKPAQKVLFSIVDKLTNEVELYKEIQVFINEYNSFLNYDKKLVINEKGVFIAPENHSLQKLSSGERHLLTFFATILLLGEEQDFILLDEPEISLDIEWQEKLLSTISKLAPNSQIIVASHSPSIMGDYFDESVEITHE